MGARDYFRLGADFLDPACDEGIFPALDTFGVNRNSWFESVWIEVTRALLPVLVRISVSESSLRCVFEEPVDGFVFRLSNIFRSISLHVKTHLADHPVRVENRRFIVGFACRWARLVAFMQFVPMSYPKNKALSGLRIVAPSPQPSPAMPAGRDARAGEGKDT